MHTDIQSHLHSDAVTERCREIWWTVYLLDCHLSSLIGAPLQLAEQDISAQLPSFAGFIHKSSALSLHVRLAKTTTLILKSKRRTTLWTVYQSSNPTFPISRLRRRGSDGQTISR